jgi:hypothetical protein
MKDEELWKKHGRPLLGAHGGVRRLGNLRPPGVVRSVSSPLPKD